GTGEHRGLSTKSGDEQKARIGDAERPTAHTARIRHFDAVVRGRLTSPRLRFFRRPSSRLSRYPWQRSWWHVPFSLQLCRLLCQYRRLPFSRRSRLGHRRTQSKPAAPLRSLKRTAKRILFS